MKDNMKNSWYDEFDSLMSWIGAGILFIIGFAFLFGFVSAGVVMTLWNWLSPLFWEDAPILGFWETWGAMVLISIIVRLFKRK